jgi:chromosomal replication initiation ATPase DnaA
MDELWNKTLAILENQMTRATFDFCFKRSELAFNNGSFVIRIPSDPAKEWLENRLSSVVARALQQAAKLSDYPQLTFTSNGKGNAPQKPTETIVRIRDRRRGKRYFIDREFVFNGYSGLLGPFAAAIYNVLSAHVGNDSQACHLYYSTLALETGMSRRQVIREIKRLEQYRLVEIERKKDGVRANDIYLLDVSEWILEHRQM